MAAGDLTCLRDYSACPAGAMCSVILLACSVLCRAVLALSRDCFCAGWSVVPGSGGLCKAPSHYDGSCPEVLDLRGAAPQACGAFVLLCLHVRLAVSDVLVHICRTSPERAAMWSSRALALALKTFRSPALLAGRLMVLARALRLLATLANAPPPRAS